MEYIAIFFTHSGAIKYDKFLKQNEIKCSLMPVPRKLSSSCGIGARFTYCDSISHIISDDIEKIYSIDNGKYKLVYEIEE